YARLEDYCQREGRKHQHDSLRPLVQVQLIGTLNFDAGSLDVTHMEEMINNYFRPLYVRVDNNTNDQDYIPEGGDIDGRDRSAWPADHQPFETGKNAIRHRFSTRSTF